MKPLTDVDVGVLRLVATGGWLRTKPTREQQESMPRLVMAGFVEVDWIHEDLQLTTAGHDYLDRMKAN